MNGNQGHRRQSILHCQGLGRTSPPKFAKPSCLIQIGKYNLWGLVRRISYSKLFWMIYVLTSIKEIQFIKIVNFLSHIQMLFKNKYLYGKT